MAKSRHLILGLVALVAALAALTPLAVHKLAASLDRSVPAGAVTLTFDDAWLSQYQTASPKLESAGFPATFFITSRQLSDFNNHPNIMSLEQVKKLKQAGFEIGAHSQNHPHLKELDYDKQLAEIQGSKQDLLDWGLGPITSFAYPFGESNQDTARAVAESKLEVAVGTKGGLIKPDSDIFQLPRYSLHSDITFDEIKKWVDDATAKNLWLVLAIHQVDETGVKYSITPEMFDQIVDYLKEKKVRVITLEQGLEVLKKAQ